MEVEFKKGAFSYFSLAGLENNCTIYQRLSANGWVEQRRNTVSDGRTIEFFSRSYVYSIRPRHKTKSPLSLAHMFRLLAWVFRSWFKSRHFVTRKGKPKIGLKHIFKSRCWSEGFQDNVVSSCHMTEERLELAGVSVCGCRLIKTQPSGLRYWQ